MMPAKFIRWYNKTFSCPPQKIKIKIPFVAEGAVGLLLRISYTKNSCSIEKIRSWGLTQGALTESLRKCLRLSLRETPYSAAATTKRCRICMGRSQNYWTHCCTGKSGNWTFSAQTPCKKALPKRISL